MALQKGGATAVTAIMFTTNTAVSSLIGLAYLDDRVRAGFTAVAVVGFVFSDYRGGRRRALRIPRPL